MANSSPFAAGKLDAVLEALADLLPVAFRQAADDLVGVAPAGRPRDPFAVVARRDASERDIVAGGEVVAHEILEDHAHAAAQLFDVVFAEVVAVEQDAAFVRVLQAG